MKSFGTKSHFEKEAQDNLGNGLFNLYADDTQLYNFFSTNNDLALTNTIAKIEECLSDFDKWMSLNKLKLNKDRTELLYLYSN